jgi:ribosomal-protein-alanine N-acetyltransferase
MEIHQIETSRLLLRRFVVSDAPEVMKMSKEQHARKWLSNQVCEDIEKTKVLLKFLITSYENTQTPVRNTFVLGIEKKDEGRLLGHVGLSPFEDFMEIGYGISEEFLNQGYATEAVSALSDWSFDHGGLDRVFGLVDTENFASRRVLEKCGFKYIESRPGKQYGKQNDCCIYERDKSSNNARKGFSSRSASRNPPL